MKWHSINIDRLLDHKILFDSLPEDGEEHGVSGICINDGSLSGEKLNRECGGVPFEFCGTAKENDNLICAYQHIEIGLNNVKKVAFLGFNEFGNYGDRLTVIGKDGSMHSEQLFFYGINQSIETLYSSEMNELCSEAVKTTANGYLDVSLYKYELPLEGFDIEEIVLPDNIEMHIMAVSVYGG